jgi:thiol-disulfide isomerase/thioredoxin
MGKAERIRRMNAREKIAAQQAAAQRAQARKRMYLASGSVLGVIAIVIGLIIWKNANTTSASASNPAASVNQASAVSKQITTVPASTLNAVGKGSNVTALTATSARQPALTSGGKPEIVYMGAEYCPYCAAERWAMVVALSRFGTFSNLHFIHSASTDIYPNTPTLSFYKSTYTSKYVTFAPVEMYGLKDNGVILQKPTAAEAALMNKYDPPISGEGSPFPFVDLGNKYLVLGAQYLPSTLAKLTWAEVAADVRDPNSAVAQGVDGTANAITAAICKITKNAPAAVCNSAAARAGAGSL